MGYHAREFCALAVLPFFDRTLNCDDPCPYFICLYRQFLCWVQIGSPEHLHSLQCVSCHVPAEPESSVWRRALHFSNKTGVLLGTV